MDDDGPGAGLRRQDRTLELGVAAVDEELLTGGVAGGISGPTVCDVETGACTTLAAVPTETESAGWSSTNWVIVAILLVVLAAIFGPPLAIVTASRRQAGGK